MIKTIARGCVALALLAACCSDGGPSRRDATGDVGAVDGAGDSIGRDLSGGEGTSDDGGPSDASREAGVDGAPTVCGARELLNALGKTHLMVGASMADATAKAAPFDLRYLYLAGGIFDQPAPCASCATGCSALGASCVGGGCAWWGCWQWDQEPPGKYVRDFLDKTAADKQLPMITYYQILHASGVNEGADEVKVAAQNVDLMKRYFADWRFVLQQIGQKQAILQLEPDFWGYAQQLGADPTKQAAAVATANATDCASQPNTIAGLGRCLVAMVRKYAPKAKVGLHASAWASGPDVALNDNAQLDVAAEARKVADFLVACGGSAADLVVVEASDRDAGYYQSIGQDRWWDDTNQTLPSFDQHFVWAKALAERVGRPLLWWQLPVGNMSLANQTDAWRDNRVDYFFAHTVQVASAHGIGFAFGSGAGGQTTPETDNGNLVAKTKAYAASGGQLPSCP